MLKYLCWPAVFFPLLLFSQSKWEPQSNPANADLWGVHFMDQNTGVVVGLDGTILKTTDGGTVWSSINSGTTEHLVAVTFFSDQEGYAVGGNWGPVTSEILYTSDGGLTWSRERSPVTSELNEIVSLSDGTSFACGAGGTIIKTVEAGNDKWVNLSFPVAEDYWALHFFDAKIGLIGGGAESNGILGIIFITTDGGSNWSEVYSGRQRVNDFFFDASGNGFAVCDSGLILRTLDSGQTWSETYVTGFSGRINSIDFSDSQHGYIVNSDGSIYQTTDGGSNWTKDLFQANRFLEDVFFVSPGIGFAVGGDAEILAFEDPDLFPTGFKNRIDMASIKVYPNPTSGILLLEMENGWDEQFEIEIRNSLGQVVERMGARFMQETIQLDLNGKAGVYQVVFRKEGVVMGSVSVLKTAG